MNPSSANFRSPYAPAGDVRGFESRGNPPFHTESASDDHRSKEGEFVTLDLKNAPKNSPIKEQNNRICRISSVLNNIKELFHSIETRISSSIESFQRDRQKDRIRQLELKSDFGFDLAWGEEKDLLDIKEALLNASLSTLPEPIYIDKSGKLCESKNSVLNILIMGKTIIAYSNPNKITPPGFKVNDKPLEIEDKSYQYDSHYHLTYHTTEIDPENGQKIEVIQEKLKIDIRDQGIRRTELALEAALSKARNTSQVFQSFYIDLSGKLCNENEPTVVAKIHYSGFTKNFSVNPMPGEETDLQLNDQEIGKAGLGGIDFKNGKNYFASDTNLTGFTINIPLITKETQIKERSDRFLKALTEMTQKNDNDSECIFIDYNGDLCGEQDASIKVVYLEENIFTAHPIVSKDSGWRVNGTLLDNTGVSGVEFILGKPTSFTRKEPEPSLYHSPEMKKEPPILFIGN
jgi:hypothetical protein